MFGMINDPHTRHTTAKESGIQDRDLDLKRFNEYHDFQGLNTQRILSLGPKGLALPVWQYSDEHPFIIWLKTNA